MNIIAKNKLRNVRQALNFPTFLQRNKLSLLLIAFLISITYINVISASIGNQVQVTIYNNPSPGYMLFGPTEINGIGLLDNCGKVVYRSDYLHTRAANDIKIQQGLITYYHQSPFGNRELYYAVNENFEIQDSFSIQGEYNLDDHEFRLLSNGSYILIGKETRVIDMSQIVPNGKPSAYVIGNVIQIMDRNDNEIFLWNSFDHFEITDATSDVDLTANMIDPFHFNSVWVDNDGNLLLSSRHLDEITKIDINTGNIIWRMGGSRSRNNEFTFINDTRDNFNGFSHQHDIKRLPNGNILLLDNGNLKPNRYTRAVEYNVDEQNKTATKVWEYYHNPSIFCESQGSVQRYSDGGTLINWGFNTGHYILTEINLSGAITLEMTGTDVDINYRIYKYLFKMAAKELDIISTGNYVFNGGSATTNTYVSMNIDTIVGDGRLLVEKHNYSAHNISFVSNPPIEVHPKRWVLKKIDLTGFSGILTFNLTDIGDFSSPYSIKVFHRDREGVGAFRELTSEYNINLNQLKVRSNLPGEYIIGFSAYNPPHLISPANDVVDHSTNVKFVWSSLSNAQSYRIQLSRSPNFLNIMLDSNLIADTSIFISNLVESAKYYWRVSANYQNNSTAWSEISRLTTLLSPPKALSPSNDTFNNKIDGMLVWKGASSVRTYKVQLSDVPDFSKLIINDSINTDYYGYSNLRYHKKYYWRLFAKSDITESKWSETSVFSTCLDTTKLISPKNKALNIRTEETIFSWNPTNGAKDYHFQLAENKDFVPCVADELVRDTFMVTDKIQKTSQKYYWRVMGINADTIGMWSETYKLTSVLTSPELIRPNDLSKNNETELTFSWTSIPESDKYYFELAEDKDFNKIIIDTLLLAENHFFWQNLKNKTNYYWRVSARNDSSYSNWSKIFTFHTRSENYLSQPNLTNPAFNGYNLPMKVVFAWDRVLTADSYIFELAKDDKFADIVYSMSDLINNFTDELTLSYGSTYYWRVKAKNNQLISEWSDLFVFSTKLSTAGLIAPFNKQEKVRIRPIFTWEAVPGATSYKLSVSEDNDFTSPLDFKSDLPTFKPDTDLKLNSAYYWKIKALNGLKESDWSEVFSFVTDNVNSVENSVESNDFSIYPNPFSDYIVISSNKLNYNEFTVDVYTVSGRKIAEYKSGGIDRLRILTDALDSDCYLFVINSESFKRVFISIKAR